MTGKKYQIDKEKCISCGTCEAVCPKDAVHMDADGKYKIDAKKCEGCGACASNCPVEAISPIEEK